MHTLQWIDLGINIVVLIAVILVCWVLLRWVRSMVQFVELMNEFGQEEMLLKARLEEWRDLISPED